MAALQHIVHHLRAALAFVGVLAGAGLTLAGALSPWAQVILFKNIDLSLPGFLFVGGGLCLAVSFLVLLGGRRSPILCLLGATCVLYWTYTARLDVPRRIKHQVLGGEMAFFPINRLLDQFHIPDIEVGGWRVPDAQLLGPGLTWTSWGGTLLLLGGALGLPGDPAVVWVYARTARARCLACGTTWLRARGADFCPACGVPASSHPHCPACGARPARGDLHCVNCGGILPKKTTDDSRQ